MSIISLHNWTILTLNVVIGATLTWLFLQLKGNSHKELFRSLNNIYYLDEDCFYLILGGVFNAVYYFYGIHILQRKLVFPVINQRKALQIKYRLIPLFKECCVLAITPTLCYCILYSLCGEIILNKLIGFLEIEKYRSDMGIVLYFYVWLFGTLYFYKMNLMRTFFNIFLTEPVIFPLYKVNETSLYLQESLNMSNLPIIQNLACLDLYNLSQQSRIRRQVLFALSQPGGHPHNWNLLVQNVLKLFSEYMDLLNNLIEKFDGTVKHSSQIIEPEKNIQAHIQSPKQFVGMRNMSMISDVGVTDLVELTMEPIPVFTFQKHVVEKGKQKFREIISFIKVFFGINYLFEVVPQASIQKVLASGQVIIWCTQAIAELACASLTEDQYGVVQKDLPAIIMSLINLKMNMDKLNKVPSLSRKFVGHEDYGFKMKGAVLSAVKRSLFIINHRFGNYINELPLNKEIVCQFQTIVKN